MKGYIRDYIQKKWPKNGQIIARTIQKKYDWIAVLLNNIKYLITPQKKLIVLNGVTYSKNFGDALNVPLAQILFTRTILEGRYLFFTPKKELLLIGSTMHLANKRTIICGAGCISPNLVSKEPPKKIVAVRGPLTAQIMRNQNIDCPSVYGDPALLLPKIYNPIIQKKYKYGIIPHYVDKQNYILQNLTADVRIIDVMCGTNWKKFINEMLECEYIISSSLHGLIVADAYNIPNVWIELSDKIDGNRFKFHDYFASVNRQTSSPIVFQTKSTLRLSLIDEALKFWQPIQIDLTKLMSEILAILEK